MLTETWLLDGVLNAELFDDRYLVWRRDRHYASTGQSMGGGVAIAVRRDLVVTSDADWYSSAEDIWVSLTVTDSNTKKSCRLHLCALYLCEQRRGNSFYTQLANHLARVQYLILSHPSDKFLIVGDYNMSNIHWLCSENGLYPTGMSGDNQSKFIDILYDCNLHQYNNVINSHDGILDLVLCNDSVSVLPCSDPLVKEDPYHKSIIIQPTFIELHALEFPKRIAYSYQRGDYEQIRSHLSRTDWAAILSQGSIDEAIE